jgi:Arc/MetJ-type ribon-helix-helix transcriptional regulator
MSQLSISIDAETEAKLQQEVERGDFDSKSAFVKKALQEYMRELAYQRILQSEREYAEGKYVVLKGSLKDHVKRTRGI